VVCLSGLLSVACFNYILFWPGVHQFPTGCCLLAGLQAGGCPLFFLAIGGFSQNVNDIFAFCGRWPEKLDISRCFSWPSAVFGEMSMTFLLFWVDGQKNGSPLIGFW